MKILVVEPEATGHRMAVYLRLVTRACAKMGWKLHLLTTSQARSHPAFDLVRGEAPDLTVSLMEDVEPSARTDALTLLRNQVEYSRAIARAFGKCAQQERFDLVYLNHLDYFDKVLAVLGSPFARTPFAGMMMSVSFHRKRMGIGPASRSNLVYERLFRRLLRIPTMRAALVIDEAFAAYAAQRGYAEFGKVRFVPDVGEVARRASRPAARSALGIPADAFVVLVYGSLTRRKGTRELLEAMARSDAPTRAIVLLAGVSDAHTRHLLSTEPAAALIGERRLVLSEGFHDETSESQVFAAADAVWLGYVDGFYGSSGVLYQAGSMGLPVITCPDGLIGWLNRKHELGVAVDPRDARAVAQSLHRLAGDPAFAAALGANGRRLSAEHSADRFQDAVVQAIRPDRVECA